VFLKNSEISGNEANQRGGGIYCINSWLLFDNTVVSNNTLYGYKTKSAYGGGIYVAEACEVTLNNSYILKNQALHAYESKQYGGGISVGSGAALQATKTVIQNNYARAYTDYDTVGGVHIFSGGTASFINCLIADNYANNETLADGIYSAGSLQMVNCTIVSNDFAGIQYAGGSVSLTNCIVWGNTDDLTNFPYAPDGTISNLYYSLIGNGDNAGTNDCITGDPMFVDTNYYHLQSVRGNYTNGYFTGGGWGESESNSPCIDAGNPDSNFDLEPSPNGNRINMGAYGNTPTASKSKSAPIVFSVH
jgi:hypothetical protein